MFYCLNHRLLSRSAAGCRRLKFRCTHDSGCTVPAQGEGPCPRFCPRHQARVEQGCDTADDRVIVALTAALGGRRPTYRNRSFSALPSEVRLFDPEVRRPDNLFLFPDRIIVVEVDQHAHRDYDFADERMREAVLAAASRVPLVWLRFNPDVWRVHGRVRKCSFDRRIARLAEEFVHWQAMPARDLMALSGIAAAEEGGPR
eukprot:tig00000492_g1430.t1